MLVIKNEKIKLVAVAPPPFDSCHFFEITHNFEHLKNF